MRAWRYWGLDVWGNEEEGFDVNDRYDHGIVCIIDEPTDDEIIKSVLGPFAKPSNYTVDGDDGYLHIELARNGRPVAQLEREDDDEADAECERDKNPLRRVIQGDPVDLDEFTEGFLEAALWATTYWDPNDPDSDASLQDVGWDPWNIPEELRRQAKKECEEFQTQFQSELQNYETWTGRPPSHQGHSAALSGMGACAGFQDHVNYKDKQAVHLAKMLDHSAEKHFGNWGEYLNNELPDPPNP
mgnify:CR=1 FL=1